MFWKAKLSFLFGLNDLALKTKKLGSGTPYLAYVLESYRCKLSFLFGFNDLALKTKKLLISLTLLTFFNEPHLKIPVLTVFLALRPGHNPKNALWTP